MTASPSAARIQATAHSTSRAEIALQEQTIIRSPALPGVNGAGLRQIHLHCILRLAGRAQTYPRQSAHGELVPISGYSSREKQNGGGDGKVMQHGGAPNDPPGGVAEGAGEAPCK